MRGLRAAQDGRTAAGACRGVPRRDTAAEAAGTGGVGTAGALSSPMSHVTERDDLNVVQVDNEIRDRLVFVRKLLFSP